MKVHHPLAFPMAKHVVVVPICQTELHLLRRRGVREEESERQYSRTGGWLSGSGVFFGRQSDGIYPERASIWPTYV